MTVLHCSAGSYSVGPHFCGELTDAGNLGRVIAAELGGSGCGALGDRPSAARPGPTA